MDRPACAKILTTRTAGRITVDVCEQGCGGLWFDRYELMSVDEADESAGEACWRPGDIPASTST